VLLSGEGFSEFASRHGNLISVKARLELKAVDRQTARILAIDRQTSVAVDLDRTTRRQDGPARGRGEPRRATAAETGQAGSRKEGGLSQQETT
jgi:hypothetical protein